MSDYDVCFSGGSDFDSGMGGMGGSGMLPIHSKILVIVVQNPKYPITVVSYSSTAYLCSNISLEVKV